MVKFDIEPSLSNKTISKSNRDNPAICAAFPIVIFCNLYNLIAKDNFISCFNSLYT